MPLYTGDPHPAEMKKNVPATSALSSPPASSPGRCSGDEFRQPPRSKPLSKVARRSDACSSASGNTPKPLPSTWNTIPPSGAGMLCSLLRKKMFVATGCPLRSVVGHTGRHYSRYPGHSLIILYNEYSSQR